MEKIVRSEYSQVLVVIKSVGRPRYLTISEYFHLFESPRESSAFCRTIYSFCCFCRNVFETVSGGHIIHRIWSNGHDHRSRSGGRQVWTNSYLAARLTSHLIFHDEDCPPGISTYEHDDRPLLRIERCEMLLFWNFLSLFGRNMAVLHVVCVHVFWKPQTSDKLFEESFTI